MATETIDINKQTYDFYNLEFDLSIPGQNIGIISGVEEIDYSEKYNREKVHGSSRLPVDRTEGDIEPDASITFLESWLRRILDAAKTAGIGRANLEMTITINYAKNGSAIVTDTLVGVKFGEIGKSFSRGPGVLMSKCPLDIMNIFMNGVDPLGNSL